LDARPATEWLAEYGPNTDNLVIRSPSHPYTRGLLASRPSSDLVTRTRLPMIPGVPPDLAHLLNRPRPLSPDGGAPRAEAAVAAGKKSAISIISRKSST
jgi:ABC-type dipeptide/oligopeptide/nickel transport system ATPase component